MAIKSKLERIIRFLLLDVWRLELSELSSTRQFVVRSIRLIITTVRGFITDQCALRASALTFYSVLSIVPVAAVAFAVAKGFGFEETLKNQLLERFSENQDALQRVFEFSDRMLQNTQGGLIAGVGIIFLFWTVIKLFGNIEKSFNYIWGKNRHRSFFRKLSDYLLLVILGPVMIIIAGSATVYIASQIDTIAGNGMAYVPAGAEVVVDALKTVVLKLIPFVLSWMLFSFIYSFIPNVKVKLSSAIFAGVIAGTAYQVTQVLFIFMQVSLARNNAIYGSFAALPLFLLWLQISWLIVLFGAELSFAYQCNESYRFEPHTLHINRALRRLLLLYIVEQTVKDFIAERPPLTQEEITLRSGIPLRLVQDLVDELIRAKIIAPTLGEEEDENEIVGYLPAVPVDRLTCHYVLEKVDRLGLDELPSLKEEAIAGIRELLEKISLAARNAPQNILLKDIK